MAASPGSGGGAGEERKLFGTDGVRGVANVHPITAEVALQLGRALAWKVRSGSHRHRIVIGKDTRLSGYMLETAIAAGICSMGVDVLLCGPLPTPGIAFITQSMRADAGVVISASHNPYQDNGIKFFDRTGFKLPDDEELEIERLVLGGSATSPDFHKLRPTAELIGKAKRIDDAIGRYVVFLKSLFPRDLTLDGMTIVVDCANGAAYHTAPAVFEELGAKVVPLHVEPDGRNINDRCGAMHPEEMARKVREVQADLGIALDGDADRVIVADENGRVVDGDAIMAIVARDLLRHGRLAKETVVATVMSNVGLERSMAEVGGAVVRTSVGDRYVVEEMRRSGYNFGGEQSGPPGLPRPRHHRRRRLRRAQPPGGDDPHRDEALRAGRVLRPLAAGAGERPGEGEAPPRVAGRGERGDRRRGAGPGCGRPGAGPLLGHGEQGPRAGRGARLRRHQGPRRSHRRGPAAGTRLKGPPGRAGPR